MVELDDILRHDRDELLLFCRRMVYAHERGVIHRDIKPHNLLRSLDGRMSDIKRTSLQRPAELWTCSAGLVLIGESDKARELLDRKAAELDRHQCVFPCESERWNRALHRFLAGALNWDKLVAMISDESGDSSWLMAQALFFSPAYWLGWRGITA